MKATAIRNNTGIVTACPPLSEKDVLNLRGQPAVKATQLKDDELRRDRDSEHRSDRDSEWVYYSLPDYTREHYFFRNGRLVKWEKTRI
ncbi:MAG: hypothetical protein HZA49_05855 [Planctomycetes bacterium]|nr:hypothetical protein [Planctomycetota bacterium]